MKMVGMKTPFMRHPIEILIIRRFFHLRYMGCKAIAATVSLSVLQKHLHCCYFVVDTCKELKSFEIKS
jgi:hypothetical protein